MAVAIPAGAKPPDKSFTKFNKGMVGAPGYDTVIASVRPQNEQGEESAASAFSNGAYDRYQTITVRIPPGTTIDTAYNEGTLVCHGGGKNPQTPTTVVPAGIYVEIGGHGGQCSVTNITLGTVVDEQTQELTGYRLSAELRCSGICNVYLNGWIKLRAGVPSGEPITQTPNPSPESSQRYRPMLGAIPSPKDMDTIVTRTDAGDHAELAISFTAPVASSSVHRPFDVIEVYGPQLTGPAAARRAALPAFAFPYYIHGNWNSGDRVTITIDVPKRYADPARGCVLRITIGADGVGWFASPNLLTGTPLPPDAQGGTLPNPSSVKPEGGAR
jgi:hypothetical protein